MKRYKKIFIYILLVVAAIWIGMLIFTDSSEWTMYFAGAGLGVAICINVLNFIPVKYNGALQYDSDVNEHTEKWNLVVNGDPSEWPMLDEILLKVEQRKDDI
jgi:hypothetical protein